LEAVAQVVGTLRAEAVTQAEVIAKLEGRAETPPAKGGVREKMQADAGLQVQSPQIIGLPAQRGGEADVDQAIVQPRRHIGAPMRRGQLPVTADVAAAAAEPALLPLPLRAEARHFIIAVLAE